jgi:hypothetical protein
MFCLITVVKIKLFGVHLNPYKSLLFHVKQSEIHNIHKKGGRVAQ